MELYQNRIVIKVGTSTLTNEQGQSDLRSFDRICRVLSDIHNKGYEVILVSSGAIALGRGKLKLYGESLTISQKQVAAAVGQNRIMFLYDKFFGDYDQGIAQILLNAEDIKQEEKKDNLTHTFDTLLHMGIIPVVNENDSVSYTEIESEERLFGDNDMLSAVVAILCKASTLLILSDIDGLYNKDPRFYPDATLIREVDMIDERVLNLAGGAGSRRGTGGMRTKIQAALLASSNGIETIITHGKKTENLYRLLEGVHPGTRFSPKKTISL